MRKLSMPELDRKTVQDFRQSPKTPVVILLDNVRSMHNVGSVFRTADAFLLQEVILCGYTPRPPHRDIQKTALGATETVKWRHLPTTLEAIKGLRQEGFSVWAVEQTSSSTPLQQVQPLLHYPMALVFGNELTGVDAAVLGYCEGSIEIPQFGMKHSFNISVAAGIVLWEIIRSGI